MIMFRDFWEASVCISYEREDVNRGGGCEREGEGVPEFCFSSNVLCNSVILRRELAGCIDGE